jgi:signal transduction histidine kinase
MMSTTRPYNPEPLRTDAARLTALNETQLLDTPPEEVFDRLTALAAKLVGVPLTFLSLVDRDRDLHKSRHEFGVTSRSVVILEGRTFCHYTLGSIGPLVLDDASQYAAFQEIPSEVDPNVRAFVGIPLTSPDGQRIGTFCAVDFQPRIWSALDIEIISELAAAASREISVRVALRRSDANAQAAREAVRAREEVLAVVAHDLRTPLNIIRFSAEALVLRPTVAEQVQIVDRMQRAATTMQDLIVDLLEVSKVRHGRIVTRQSRIAPDDLLRDAELMMLPIAERSSVTLTSSAPTGLGFVMVDYERILRVLANLIGNAIKFSDTNGQIMLAAQHSSSMVKFTIADNGLGVKPADLPHIFERFWQGEGQGTKGSGLGLAIAREIVEAHGGTIGVESSPSHGATFYFTLPSV